MSNILNSFMTFAGLLLVFNLAQAQPGARTSDPDQMAKRQTEHMVNQLALSEEQAAQVKEINLKYAKKLQIARQEATGRSEMQAALQNIKSEKDEELKAVLTEEQFEIWKEIRNNNQRRGPLMRSMDKKG